VKRDLRDPMILGATLLGLRGRKKSPLSKIADANRGVLRQIPRYSANPTPHEKYGDPRSLPSTLPN